MRALLIVGMICGALSAVIPPIDMGTYLAIFVCALNAFLLGLDTGERRGA